MTLVTRVSPVRNRDYGPFTYRKDLSAETVPRGTHSQLECSTRLGLFRTATVMHVVSATERFSSILDSHLLFTLSLDDR